MAITCEKCGLEYLREVDYCGQCGTFIGEEKKDTVYCPVCKARALQNASFCVDCGKSLPKKDK